MTVAVDSAASNPLRGIVLKVCSVIVFVGMQTSLKSLGEDVPAGQLVFFRSFFALVPVVIYLSWLGDLGSALKTNDIPGHLVRGLIGVSSMVLGFFAISRLPYPEWISISYAAPLLTVVFAAIFLRETVRAYRWGAVLVGLIGVIVVCAPNFTFLSEDVAPQRTIGVLASFAAAAFSAVAMIQVRRLVQKEQTATIVVYFSLTCSLISLFTLPFGWIVPTAHQALLLVLAGLFGGVGQLLLTACYRYADTSTIAPFEYTSMLLAILIGYMLFDEAASPTTLTGAAIVISAGIFIILREHRLGLERKKARGAATPQG